MEEQLINQDVRNGTVKLVYRSVETASGDNPDPNAFNEQQVAAEAAGLQDKEWYYIELFYDEQGAEGSDYVTSSFIDGMAKQIPGIELRAVVKSRPQRLQTAEPGQRRRLSCPCRGCDSHTNAGYPGT
jgi:hypothetical protein